MTNYTSETKLQRAIIDALKKAGIWVVRMQVKGSNSKRSVSTGEPGMPDLWTPYCWIEVKMPDKDLSKVQRAWHDKARKHGQHVFVARSVGDAVKGVAGFKMRHPGLVPWVPNPAGGWHA